MAKSKLTILDCFALESPLATEYRRLLQNIRRRSHDKELKSLLVTSSVTGEGKSTVSSLLAITAARKGFKTLLLDCDLRRPAIHRLFLINRAPGLVEVVLDGVPFKSVVRKTALENLDLVTAGKVIPHPSEIFNGNGIESLINELKFYYDYAIIDSPPVIPVSDPMLLSQSTDGVLMVVKAGSTAREVAGRATDILRSNGADIVGVMLNNSGNTLPYYYDYSHYHYDYTPRDDSPSGSTDPRNDSRSPDREKKAGRVDGSRKHRA